MEVVAAADDLGLSLRHALFRIRPFAGGLDGGLDAFRAGVHGQDGLHLAQTSQFLAERPELVVVERS